MRFVIPIETLGLIIEEGEAVKNKQIRLICRVAWSFGIWHRDEKTPSMQDCGLRARRMVLPDNAYAHTEIGAFEARSGRFVCRYGCISNKGRGTW